MGNISTSATSTKLNYKPSLNNEAEKNIILKNISSLPSIASFVLWSMYALTGSPILTRGARMNDFALNQISSISEFNNIEKRFIKSDYSWVTASGFDENDANFPSIFY